MNPYDSGVPVPGSVVGDWKLARELGRGTTSIVFAASRVVGDDDDVGEVALKLALPGTLRDQTAVDRFLRGAQAQRTLAATAEGVLPVLDLGTDQLAGPYLVTPLVAGPTLGAALARRELPVSRALAAISDVGEVLDAAASAGLVHRDVKPSNVLLGPDRAWLADFGLARDHEDDPTMTGAVAGTLAYLAPELVRGGNPSPASDRYALACLAFQALTGTPVFPRPTDAAILYAHVDEAPPSATDRRPALPSAVDAVLQAGLAKDPALRPTSASAFAAELARAVGDAAATLGPPSPATDQAGQETADPTPDLALHDATSGQPDHSPRPATPAPRRRRVVIAGGAAAVLAIGALVAVTGAGDDPPAMAAAAPAVGPGLVALGSSLQSVDGLQSRDCEGAIPNGASPACSLLQRTLPGRQLVVPAKGLIRSWAVRGASGELTLQILRSRDGVTYQVSRAETVRVPTTGAHRFETELETEAGDLVAVDVAPGSAIGLRDADGATTERWTSPVGAGSGPGRRTGLDREVLLRAELEVGAVRTLPRQLTGTEAESAPDGRELAASSAALPDGRQVRVALRLVEGKVVLDLERGGKRRSRLFVPRVDPKGHVVELHAFESPGNASQLNFAWRNPGELKDVEQYFGLDAESLEAYT